MPRWSVLPVAAAVALAALTVAAEARAPRAVVYEGSCANAPPPGTTRLWMGHFTGGRFGPPPVDRHIVPRRTIEWADEYRCFSRQERCYAWQREMRRAYGRIESNWTCLPLR